MKNLILTEIKLKSTDWANISDKRYDRDPITISRGKAASGGQASPTEANVTVNNTGGVFSPRNPQSPIFGSIGRNTPIRISVVRDEASKGLVLVRSGNGNAETLDNAQTSITGDIDVRIDLELLDDGDTGAAWKWPTADFDLCSKWNFVVGQLSWAFLLLAGKPTIRWSADGTNGNTAQASTTLAGPDKGRRALRFTFDVDNGAAGRTVRFYQASTIAGPWTQIGTDTVQAGVTSIFDGTANNRVGAGAQNNAWTWGRSGPAVVYDYEIRNGINGTLVADPDFTARPIDPVPFGSSSWTDALGNGWFLVGDPDAARIWYAKTWTRVVGEIAELPPRWDPSHSDKYVPIVANGILRRLGQGKSPVGTGLRDFILRSDNVDALAAYFPLSGAEGTTYSLNIAPSNQYLRTRFYGQQVLGGNIIYTPKFTYGKDLGAPWLGSGMEIDSTDLAYMRGDVVTADANCALDFVWQSPALGVLTAEIQDYNVNTWDLVLDTSSNAGTLQVSFNDPNVGPIGFAVQGPFPELQDTAVHHCRFQLTTVGADTQFAVYIDGTLRSSGTMTGYTLNGVSLFRFFYSRYTGQTVVNLAHVAMWANANAAQIPAIADTYLAAVGYIGETAGARITRACSDGGIPLQVVGAVADTTMMGAQFAEPRLAQIRDAEATDFGILTEQRTDNGLLYRTRVSQYAQAPVVFDYSARVVAPPFEPTDDDQDIRNDVTASRRNGGSVQLTLKTGPMSILDPPAGIGQYEDEVTVNVQNDDQLVGVAAWWLNQGTLDAARYPSVTFNLAAAEITSVLRDQILDLDVGDRIQIQNVDAADIPDDLDLIVLGYSETFDNTSWLITFNCAPGQPYAVAKYDTARYDADGSVLTAGISSSALTLQATQTGTSLWTTDPAAFPFDVAIGGERMTVSNITGATSPQTFTISARAVNGVVKSHSANEPIRLWDTPRYAL